MAAMILDKVAGGAPDAFEACVVRFGGLIWSLARRRTPTLAEAEDAVQEIFLDLWRHAQRYDPERGSEETFVVMIARRRLIDRQRRRGRQPVEACLNEAMAIPAAPLPDLAERTEEVQLIRDRMQHLRDEERQILELAICDGLSQAQISEKIQMPLGTIKTHARRGLMRLRELIEPSNALKKGGT